jgi:purine-nucleoside phosphorylase
MNLNVQDYRKKVEQTAKYLNKTLPQIPNVAIMLGSGLGGLVQKIENQKIISYSKVPNFPHSSVKGHAGQLVYGTVGKNAVMAFQGRWHYYEGYTMQQVTFYVRVLKVLGVENLIVTNAAGGLRGKMTPGDIMLITDQINLLGANPLLGPNDDFFGPRFPAMNEAYDLKLQVLAKKTAKSLKIKLQKGVYCAISGPNYETHAELHMLRTIGSDAVGMSTVPEVLVARHCGVKVLGFSAITDVIRPGQTEPITHEEVLKVANEMGVKFTKLVTEILKKM